MWSTTHFPSAMRSLNPTVRAKAVEIANGMIAGGHTDKPKVVATSIDQARAWMRRMTADAVIAGAVYHLSTI